MKRLHASSARLILTLVCFAASAGLWPTEAQTSAAGPDAIGPDYRIWSFGPPGTAGRSGAAPIMQLETGLNYYNPTNSQWLRSEAVFEVGPDGQSFIAERVQHRIRLNGQLNTQGAVSLRMDDGLALDSTPVAFALYDPVSGNTAVIGTLTNSTAIQVSSNEVMYPDVFAGSQSGVFCDVSYAIQNGTFSQDCTVTCRFDPRDWGFSTNCWVQVITEFYGALPAPDQLSRPVWNEEDPTVAAQMASPQLTDATLGFGRFVMTAGRAYTGPTASMTNGAAALVGKEFKTVGGRVFLVETLPYAWLMEQFLNLPDCASTSQAELNRSDLFGTDYASIPSPPERGETGQRVGRVAGLPSIASGNNRLAAAHQSGVCIDYVGNIGGTITNTVLLQSYTNYLITGPVYLNGPVQIEGRTVLKYKHNAYIQLNNPTFTCKNSGQFSPVVATAVDDDSIGDSMKNVSGSGYTGTVSGTYAAEALWMNGITSLSLTNFRFCYANSAIYYDSASAAIPPTNTVSHCQFLNCYYPFNLYIGPCVGQAARARARRRPSSTSITRW